MLEVFLTGSARIQKESVCSCAPHAPKDFGVRILMSINLSHNNKDDYGRNKDR